MGRAYVGALAWAYRWPVSTQCDPQASMPRDLLAYLPCDHHTSVCRMLPTYVRHVMSPLVAVRTQPLSSASLI